MSLFNRAVQASTKVIKLKMQSPQAVANVIRQSFGHDLRVAEAPMINAVVISSDDEKMIAGAEALISEIDRVPATLQYSVRLVSEDQARGLTAEIDADKNAGALSAKWLDKNSRSTETRTLVGLEGEKLKLTDETVRVETLPAPWGEQPVIIKQERGLKISGRLAGKNEAVVAIHHAEGTDMSANTLVTQVRAPLGQWFFLGNLDKGDNGNNESLNINQNSFIVGGKNNRGSLKKLYMIKIDLLKKGE